jgi:hypothetical protein
MFDFEDVKSHEYWNNWKGVGSEKKLQIVIREARNRYKFRN